MPRIDPLRNKVSEFREHSGEHRDKEQAGYDHRQPSENNEHVAESVETPKPTIDFSPYLRDPKYSFDDVVLPQATKHQVDSIVAELQYEDLIYNEWGMREKHKLDKALSVNFFGSPGTGKTLTAEALASALGMKIVVVPYQQLESKYVGETPKNIAAAFEFATRQKAVLFFDEADSFLGKRLENVTQSTDTAVNLTRSVMIMQLSEYEGIVIFATNLIRNYDPAFISRIRWKVQFDLPDKEGRSKIWQAQIPSKLPLDTSVNFVELAHEFEGVSGRDIKNAVFQAVVSAAKENKPKEEKRVTQAHFIAAMKEVIEMNKASVRPTLKLSPVEDVNVELPPQPPSTEHEKTT